MSAMGSTPSQQWARRKGACARGRRDLGWKSIGEYWRTSRNKGNLYWILCRLTEYIDDAGLHRCPEWLNRMNYSAMTPREMRQVAHANGVMIPLELS